LATPNTWFAGAAPKSNGKLPMLKPDLLGLSGQGFPFFLHGDPLRLPLAFLAFEVRYLLIKLYKFGI